MTLRPPSPPACSLSLVRFDSQTLCGRISRPVSQPFSLVAEEEARFTKNLSSVEGTETDSVKLICEVSKPSADVTWYKGDEELPEGGRYDQIVDGKRRILLIQDLKMTDAGEYNCRLSPSIRTSANLKINGNQISRKWKYSHPFVLLSLN